MHDDSAKTVWVDLMTLRPLQPGQDKPEEMRLDTVKAEDVDTMIAFWSPALPKNGIWHRPSARKMEVEG